jgi:hypothetical protein
MRARAAFPAHRLALALVALLAAAGCSLLNAPGALRDGPDGGAVDADVPDSDDLGADGGPKRAELCDDRTGVDEDEDGLANCADYDCAGFAACCSGGERFPGTPVRDWRTAVGGDWLDLPNDGGGVINSGMSLISFGPTRRAVFLRAGRLTSCAPIGLGATVRANFAPTGAASPDAGPPSEAALVLTSVQAPPADGSRLVEDLRVGVTGDGRIFVTRGGVSLLAATVDPVAPGTNAVFDISLGPGVADGVGVLLARVSVTVGAGGPRELMPPGGAPIARLDALLDCGGGKSGLALAIEGIGDGVRVGTLTAETRTCASPSQFVPSTTTLLPDSLPDTAFGAPPSDWRAGGVGAPALAASGSTTMPFSVQTYDLFYDASNLDRELERVSFLDFAVGGSILRGNDLVGGMWMPRGVGAGEAVLPPTPGDVSSGFPTCTSGCAGMGRRSIREPALTFVMPSDRSEEVLRDSAQMLVAAEVDPERAPEVYGLYRVTFGGLAADALPVQATALLLPAGVGGAGTARDPECVSLRDPALAPLPKPWWSLFYTCERASGAPSIRAIAVWPDLSGALDEPFDVLDAAQLGEYARDGVRAPEVLVGRPGRSAMDPRAGTDTVRMWFTALSAGVATVGVADAVVPSEGMPLRMTPYPGNPVLTASTPALGACDGSCALAGLAVTRDLRRYAPADAATYARFVVARRLDRSGGAGTEWQLIPLEQVLGVGW